MNLAVHTACRSARRSSNGRTAKSPSTGTIAFATTTKQTGAVASAASYMHHEFTTINKSPAYRALKYQQSSCRSEASVLDARILCCKQLVH